MTQNPAIQLVSNNPRKNWQQAVEDAGLIWHGNQQEPYWTEDKHIRMTLAAAETLEDAATRLHQMCMHACQVVIDRNLWHKLGIPPVAIPLIKDAWSQKDFFLYGRFDLAWNGTGSPKLLEYNADTPTSLLEASVIQWQWLQDLFPDNDQLNSIHEALVERWKDVPEEMVHFACVWESLEDRQTIAYLAETAEQADKSVELLDMEELGFNHESQRFTDTNNRFIDKLFKLYPWEAMADEQFFAHVPAQRSRFIEPIWKMMLSNKGILPILWELYPGDPLLLPSFFTEQEMIAYGATTWAAKPFFGREGSGITIKDKTQEIGSGVAGYEKDPVAYQEYTELFQAEETYFVWGLWMVGDECRGLSVRGDKTMVTGNLSRFYPHRIEG